MAKSGFQKMTNSCVVFLPRFSKRHDVLIILRLQAKGQGTSLPPSPCTTPEGGVGCGGMSVGAAYLWGWHIPGGFDFDGWQGVASVEGGGVTQRSRQALNHCSSTTSGLFQRQRSNHPSCNVAPVTQSAVNSQCFSFLNLQVVLFFFLHACQHFPALMRRRRQENKGQPSSLFVSSFSSRDHEGSR